MTIANETRLDQSSGVAAATSLLHSLSSCANVGATGLHSQLDRRGAVSLSRERALIQARATETSARQALARTITFADNTCAIALSRPGRLQVHLNAIHAHLHAAGYLYADRASGRDTEQARRAADLAEGVTEALG
jgi:hypothetical protein